MHNSAHILLLCLNYKPLQLTTFVQPSMCRMASSSLVATSGSIESTCEFFDCALNKWTTVAPLNTAREFASAATHADTVYVFGGRDSSSRYLDDVEQYDYAANKWTVLQARLTVARIPWQQSVSTDASSLLVVITGIIRVQSSVSIRSRSAFRTSRRFRNRVVAAQLQVCTFRRAC